MFGFWAPKARPARPIQVKSINRPAMAVEAMARSRPGGALAAIDAAGSTLTYTTTKRPFLVRLTAVGTSINSGSYSWQAISPNAGSPGTYTDLAGWSGAIGGDAAWEINGTSTLAVNDRVEVKRDWYSGQLRFQYSHC